MSSWRFAFPGKPTCSWKATSPISRWLEFRAIFGSRSYKSPIEIADTTGAVRVDTYKETVKLRNVNLRGPLEIKSYKADADIDARNLGESVTLENEKGSIVLRVPANAGMDVDYEGGRRSSFSSDFPMTSQTGSFNSSFHGKVNQGGTRVRLRTGKGSVSLQKLSGGM